MMGGLPVPPHRWLDLLSHLPALCKKPYEHPWSNIQVASNWRNPGTCPEWLIRRGGEGVGGSAAAWDDHPAVQRRILEL